MLLPAELAKHRECFGTGPSDSRNETFSSPCQEAHPKLRLGLLSRAQRTELELCRGLEGTRTEQWRLGSGGVYLEDVAESPRERKF